jgi:hypothetical protein
VASGKTGGNRGFPAIFWEYAEHAYQLNAVSESALARELGLDRKHLRETRLKLGWQRMGERPIGAPDAAKQTAHNLMVEMALCFKSGEFADYQALWDGAYPESIANFMAARTAARHG